MKHLKLFEETIAYKSSIHIVDVNKMSDIKDEEIIYNVASASGINDCTLSKVGKIKEKEFIWRVHDRKHGIIQEFPIDEVKAAVSAYNSIGSEKWLADNRGRIKTKQFGI